MHVSKRPTVDRGLWYSKYRWTDFWYSFFPTFADNRHTWANSLRSYDLMALGKFVYCSNIARYVCLDQTDLLIKPRRHSANGALSNVDVYLSACRQNRLLTCFLAEGAAAVVTTSRCSNILLVADAYRHDLSGRHIVVSAVICYTGELVVHPDAVSSGPQGPVGPWCRITYHCYRDHIGTPGCSLPVHTDSVHVFSDLHHGVEGLCLVALRPTSPSPSSDLNTRPVSWSHGTLSISV